MTRIGKGFLFVIASGIMLAAGVQAQTINAASCSESAVQSALNSVSQSSATVNIPAGTCTWTSGISYTVPSGTTSLTIQGAGAEYATAGGASTAGTDETVITDGYNSTSALVNVTAAADQTARITGVAFLQNSSTPSVKYGMVVLAGDSTTMRVDHCHFYSYISGNKDVVVYAFGGVADHNFFGALSGIITNDFGFYNGNGWGGLTDPTGYGNASWAVADNFGTDQFFFAEDDLFNNGWVSDCTDGGRFVIRHSTMTGANGIEIHGISGSAYRGCRAGEIYDNNENSGSGNVFNGGIAELNSGAYLVWGNTVTNYTIVVSLAILRQSNVTYPETAPPNGWGYCGTAQTGVTSVWDGNVNSTGYPCIDSPGRGKGDLITGSAFPNIVDSVAGTQTWPHQVLDPIYVWDNTYTPPGYSDDAIIGDQTNGNLADNRDYYQQFGTYGESGTFNGTAGINQSSSAPSGDCTAGKDPKTGTAAPGVGWWDTSNNTLYVCDPANTWSAYYTPYTYPDPLTSSTTSSAPAAPTDLAASVN
jgi:hypothetical protein